MNIEVEKKVVRFIKEISVRPEEWQLYQMNNQHVEVAQLLTNRFTSLVNEGLSESEVRTQMENALSNFSWIGADDSEPHEFLNRLIKKVFE